MHDFWRRLPLRSATALALLVAACPLRAQVPTTAAIGGTVASATGERIPDVLVTLTPLDGGPARSVYATAGGEFIFSFLAPGRYALVAERVGFAPTEWQPLVLRPAVPLRLDLRLQPAGEAPLVRTVLDPAPSALPPGHASARDAAAVAVPLRQGLLSELTKLSARGDQVSIEGLPGSLSGYAIDGVLFRPAAHPGESPFASLALPWHGSASAELVSGRPDVRYPQVAGSVLAATSERGADRTSARLDGYWSGDPLLAPSFAEGVGFTTVRGELELAARPSARLAVRAALHAAREEQPLGAAWPEDAGGELDAALAARGVSVAGYRRAAVAETERISGFARADWSAANGSGLALFLHGAVQPRRLLGLEGYPDLVDTEATDVLAGGSWRSAVSTRFANELSVAVTSSERSNVEPDAPWATALVHEGLRLGAGTGKVESSERFVRVSNVLELARGAHTWTLMASLGRGRLEYDLPDRDASSYLFGSADDLLAGRGVLVRAESGEGRAEWSSSSLSVGAQDYWRASNRLHLLAGVRLDQEDLPDGVRRDAEWLRLSGVANDEVKAPGWLVSPMAGVRLDLTETGSWALDGGVSVQHGRLDPRALAAWQADDGSIQVRRVVGDVTWPPSGAAGGATVPRLTLLASEFSAPRTLRGSISLVHRPDVLTRVQATAVIRRTRGLPQLTDLNLLPVSVAQDQHGRMVFGSLVQQGGLLVAEPGSNRLFPSYDRVLTISDEGRSDYAAGTLAVERMLTPRLNVQGSYTFSRTVDDWFGAAAGGLLAPAGVASGWVDGTSDFDVPHRAVLGLSATTAPGLTVRGSLRVQSGLPFTPGYRHGVDANGDGEAGNDPAFVDTSIPGVDALASEWDCLGSAAGRFADRNGCRSASLQLLDIGVTYELPVRSLRASIMLDAFDLLERGARPADAALFLVDPAATLQADPEARTITVPLIVNPNFGEPLTRRHSGRQVRLGVSLAW